MQRVQQYLCRAVTAEDDKGLRVIVRTVASEGIFKIWAKIDDRDLIAVAGKVIGGSETSRASSKNCDRMGASGRHVDRERNQTPAATASR